MSKKVKVKQTGSGSWISECTKCPACMISPRWSWAMEYAIRHAKDCSAPAIQIECFDLSVPLTDTQ